VWAPGNKNATCKSRTESHKKTKPFRQQGGRKPVMLMARPSACRSEKAREPLGVIDAAARLTSLWG
jgi:hypothetical protein